MSTLTPTSHPGVNQALRALLAGARKALGDAFVGLYLHGSLAGGDFDPGRSDVDFLVVTRTPMPDATVDRLRVMHARLSGSGLRWVTRLEGTYLPRVALRRYDPGHPAFPSLRVDGTVALDRHDRGWVIQRHILRERGVVVAGPSIGPLIDPVGPDDLRAATRAVLAGWWARQLEDPALLRTSEYQAYAILTMCRALYTLEHGAVSSKTRAAHWALAHLPDRWRPLIALGLAWRHGTDWDRLEETLAFMRFVMR